MDHFFSLSFGSFKLPESCWNRFIMILLDQELNFKKNPIGNYYFFLVEKYFWKKKSEKFSKKFQNHNWNFSKNFRTFFSKMFFDKKKIKFFDRFFLKFNSWSRRIIIKRFQHDSGSLKRPKLKGKKCSTEIRRLW